MHNKTKADPLEGIDVVLEMNDPKNLDLSKNQLFIDTSKTYKYYDEMLSWNHDEQARNIRLFVSLRKFHKEFILYNRCDGIDECFGFADSSFEIFGLLESEINTINKFLKKTDNEMIVELLTHTSTKTIVSIQPSEYENVFQLHYKNDESDTTYYVASVKDIKKFNLVVNHCVDRKIVEFMDVFDK